ncbi:hypothetical protein Cni_G03830 [Canna indica]|uniref:Uncharacterized protein n=1 Tax=Canna indica TaxID=4628 RepID=A0AAQ3Q263_9LILI|nr:hypothetical protein Cni_G03830 [Canna indica]
MDGDAERMVALKRAYADIILNTAKESAARILTAERRVLQSQHSLSLTKEESLAMLLRLKAFMDSKNKEAEKVNLSQAKKIQELEVQLCEAKHTIHHLNSELRKLSSEVESEKSHEIESLEEKDAVGMGCVISHKDDCQECRYASGLVSCSQFGTTYSPNSDLNVAASSQRTVPPSCLAKYTAAEEPSKDMIASDDSAGNPDLVSLILRNKEPELRRNGCTQRIHAFEQNLLTSRELPGQKHALPSDKKHEAVTRGDALAERQRVGVATIAVGMVVQAKKLLETEKIGQGGNIHENGRKVKFSRRRSSRKRGVRKLAMEDHDQSDINNSKVAGQNIMSISSEKQVDNNEDSFSCLVQAAVGNHETPKDENITLKKISNSIVPGILYTGRVMTRRTKKLCNINSENHCGESTVSISPNDSQENIKKEEVTMSTYDMEGDTHSERAAKDDAIDTQLECEPMLTTPDHEVIGYLNTSDSNENHMVGVPLSDFGSKDEEPGKSSGLPAEVGNDRIVKYTFKRTRKRGTPDSKNEAVSLEENKSKRKAADKEHTLLEPSKPNILTESTRDSRRLAQVARQLISLSEKRWW